MASKTLVTVEEYLSRSFDGPEPEYVDGEIVERHLGSIPHCKAQERMLEFFRSLKQSWSLFAYPEVTLRLSPSRYRIADVAVFAGDVPSGKKYPTDPPDVVIEIVSEDDRYVEILEKLAEYHTWGVKQIWLVDPWTRKFSIYDGSELHGVPAFDLPEYNARISVGEFFAA
jgi:Uma2 family endonuclease